MTIPKTGRCHECGQIATFTDLDRLYLRGRWIEAGWCKTCHEKLFPPPSVAPDWEKLETAIGALPIRLLTASRLNDLGKTPTEIVKSLIHEDLWIDVEGLNRLSLQKYGGCLNPRSLGQVLRRLTKSGDLVQEAGRYRKAAVLVPV